MAQNGVNSTTISRSNTGFPDYLDFNALRADAIDYLGNLTGKVWTDYNLHDPGITILEMLCYAVLDLGYRTQFPAADVFATDPAGGVGDRGFFTPSKILSCNPLTILDYRKMLIDIEGVKNAWLEVDEGPVNGLYKVHIELEDTRATDDVKDDIVDAVRRSLMGHRNFCEDFEDIGILSHLAVGVCADVELENDADAETVYRTMIAQLQEFFAPSPRFYTLRQLLDKQVPIEDIYAGRPYNVSTSHGFVDTAELEALTMKKEIHLSDVYAVLFKISGVRNVRRLQLLNCGNKTEKIGWRFQLPDRHIPVLSTDCSSLTFTQNGRAVGQDFSKLNPFLDLSFTAEPRILYTSPFPNLDAGVPAGNYRKDLGDYYSIQNEFPRVYGIAAGGLPDNVPDWRKARALQLKGYLLFFDQLLAGYLTQLQNMRRLFSTDGGADGMGRTGGAGPMGSAGQTYYLQEPVSVPDLNRLLRFGDGHDQDMTLAIPVDRKALQQALRKIPVDLREVDRLLTAAYPFTSAGSRSIVIQQLTEDLANQEFTYDTGGDYSVNFFQVDQGCWAFYVLASSPCVALAGKGYYDSRQAAESAFRSLRFLGTFIENYSIVRKDDGGLSFNVRSHLASYTGFLQRLVEDRDLYRQRKGQFLDHLLARFAEQFTDYALLSYPFMDAPQLADAVLTKKQQFLSGYDRLSSGRGKGFDYSTRHPGDAAISGVEKKVAALAGFNDACSGWLCNFVVEAVEDSFYVRVKIGDRILFSTPGKFYSAAQAEAGVKALFAALPSYENYKVYFDRDRQAHSLKVTYDKGRVAYFSGADTAAAMEKVRVGLVRLFSTAGLKDDVYVSEKVYRIIIRKEGEGQDGSGKNGGGKDDGGRDGEGKDGDGKDDIGNISEGQGSDGQGGDGQGNGSQGEVLHSTAFFANEAEAQAACKDVGARITEAGAWQPSVEGAAPFQHIYIDERNPEHLRFVDLGGFRVQAEGDGPKKMGGDSPGKVGGDMSGDDRPEKVEGEMPADDRPEKVGGDSPDNMPDKPVKFAFTLSDEGGTFSFRSLKRFNTQEEAELQARHLLPLLAEPSCFRLHSNRRQNKFSLYVVDDNEVIARTEPYAGRDQANQAKEAIRRMVLERLYILSVEEQSHRWKFDFYIDDDKGGAWKFTSVEGFAGYDEAWAKLEAVYEGLGGWATQVVEGKLQLAEGGQSVLEYVAPAGGVPGVGPGADRGMDADAVKEADSGAVKGTDAGTVMGTDPGAVKGAVDEWLGFKKDVIAFSKGGQEPQVFQQLTGNTASTGGLYVYRLVDKGHLQAVYTGPGLTGNDQMKNDLTGNDPAGNNQAGDKPRGDDQQAVMERKKTLYQDTNQYEYMEISLGGDIFHRRTDAATGRIWWHYHIKSRKPLFGAEEVVLFESVQGYASEEEAQRAFDAYYLDVLGKALDKSNYGEGLYISLREVLVHGDDPNQEITSTVFVPERTRDIIHAGDDDQLKDALILAAKKYPVRLVTSTQADAEEFTRRFPCAVPVSNEGACMSGTIVKKEYYFVLTDKDGRELWQSVHYYPTAVEARTAFYFFLALLNYPGNYSVQRSFCSASGRTMQSPEGDTMDADCTWEIYIREVLAESRQHYATADAAWAAVEPFTCVAQSKDAFHALFESEQCGYTYFISCRSGNWIHPCKYDTTEQRNGVKDRLTKAIQGFYKQGKVPFLSKDDPGIILDKEGQLLGKLWKEGNDTGDIFPRYLELVYRLFHCPVFQEKTDGFYLLDELGKILLQSIQMTGGIEDWKQRLLQWAYYFPVTATVDGKYCLQVRLPGFNHMGDDMPDNNPCGCETPGNGGDDDCFVAWESACCFNSCSEALAYYFNEIGKLQAIGDYRSVFYCDCGGFGIELAPDDVIVAYNPQTYLTVDMDCAAIGRAKCLINAEGMRVVEHILLRQKSPGGERDCEALNKPCDNGMHCSFVWHAGEDITFVPGADRYSFIATVALPSWSQRFRSKESRLIIENLLQREAPAHVLLRILWLTPKDLCNLESYYRQWRHSLTSDRLCRTEYHPCDFPTYLFTTAFQCPADCTECPPCQDQALPANPCFSEPCDQVKKVGPFTVVNQVNEIFCWAGSRCGEQVVMAPVGGGESPVVPVASVGSEPSVGFVASVGSEPPVGSVASVGFEPSVESVASVTSEPPVESVAPVTSEPFIASEQSIAPVQPVPSDNHVAAPSDVPPKDAVDGSIVDRRFTRYREGVQFFLETPGTGMAGQALAFLQTPPNAEEYLQLIDRIIANEPSGAAETKLTRVRQGILVASVTFYYLDNLIFQHNESQLMPALRTAVARLRKEGLLPDMRLWNEEEVKKAKANIDLREVHQLLK